MNTYFFINIGCPKPGNGTFIRIRRKNGGTIRPGFIDILHDEERLTDRLFSMEENWDFLTNRV